VRIKAASGRQPAQHRRLPAAARQRPWGARARRYAREAEQASTCVHDDTCGPHGVRSLAFPVWRRARPRQRRCAPPPRRATVLHGLRPLASL